MWVQISSFNNWIRKHTSEQLQEKVNSVHEREVTRETLNNEYLPGIFSSLGICMTEKSVLQTLLLLLDTWIHFIFLLIQIRGCGLLTLMGLLSCKSYFHFITSAPNNVYFLLDKPIQKSIAPSKVKSFVWTVVLNMINSNDFLQIWRPLTALSPCLMCRSSSQTNSHLFLHCSTTSFLWNNPFGVFGEQWVSQLIYSSSWVMILWGLALDAIKLWQCTRLCSTLVHLVGTEC